MGADANINGESLYYGIPNFFHVIFLPTLKISFFFELEWLKVLKDIFDEGYPIVASEINHNFIYPFYCKSVL